MSIEPRSRILRRSASRAARTSPRRLMPMRATLAGSVDPARTCSARLLMRRSISAASAMVFIAPSVTAAGAKNTACPAGTGRAGGFRMAAHSAAGEPAVEVREQVKDVGHIVTVQVSVAGEPVVQVGQQVEDIDLTVAVQVGGAVRQNGSRDERGPRAVGERRDEGDLPGLV